jgi:serine/threonine protein kinase
VVSISIEPGFRLGKYEVMEHLATGGMGAVFKAVDRDLGRLVALKVLSPQLMENGLALERFRREARHAARLNHPNIVTLYEFGHDQGRQLAYLALEFIDGIELAKYIAMRGKLRPDEARRILTQVAKALGHAFEHGVVHRDIKPSNIMLARVGSKARVMVTDLGLAITKGENEFRVTREGNTVGTIDYLAPEQARDSQAVDTRSDIYSLGCTAYHMLAGKPPFAEGGIGERLFKHLEAPPPDVRQFNLAVSAGLWAVIEKMLAKQPADRYANPHDLLRALKRTKMDAVAPRMDSLPVSSEYRKTRHIATAPTRLSIAKQSVEAEPSSGPKPNDSTTAGTVVSKEQARAAAAFYERASQVLAQGGGEDYARQLLDDCLKLDPFHLAGRKALRALHQANAGGALGRWFDSLNMLALKSKMRLARSTGDWRKVFEHGEHLLAHQPSDADTHIELAKTATELGLADLARWFLEQGCQQAPNNAELLRALALFHEQLQQWKPAIALWHQVAALEPTNYEAHRKLNDLSAQTMVSNGPHRK